jgi:hypothetical protein
MELSLNKSRVKNDHITKQNMIKVRRKPQNVQRREQLVLVCGLIA